MYQVNLSHSGKEKSQAGRNQAYKIIASQGKRRKINQNRTQMEVEIKFFSGPFVLEGREIRWQKIATSCRSAARRIWYTWMKKS